MPNHIKLSTITSLSPLDGRYAKDLPETTFIFSELSLTLARLDVEIEWLKTLAKEPKIKEIKPFDRSGLKFLRDIIVNFTVEDIERIKELEQETNHDIKAIEYFLKKKLATDKKLTSYQEFVHFGITSDDINNLAYAVIMAKSRDEILLPIMDQIIFLLKQLSEDYANTAMLARTHGQAASPTTFGKEMANFAYRLVRQFDYLFITPILGKFNGAVGNFNALYAAYPKIDWEKISRKFIEGFNLTYNPFTTQIEPHDWIVEYCNSLARFNTILIDFCRDIWGYTSIGYLKQKTKSKEIGSSTMPHKVNPINFENAEGNLGIANSLLDHFANKLPISRFQRDLTDSTVMRNLGVAIGHSVLAYKSLIKGLDRISVDKKELKKDLNEHWEILAEPIQTIMRRHKIETSYEQMKKLTRGQKVDKKTLHKFIKQLNLPAKAKQQMLKLTPENYLGLATKLAQKMSREI